MSQDTPTGAWNTREIVTLLPSILPLSLKSSVAYIEFKWQARKAKKIFVGVLTDSGMDREAAAQLADSYLSPSRMLGTILRRRN